MKKIFLLLLTFFFIPFSAFAISLSELQSNPDKYFLIDKDLHTTSYRVCQESCVTSNL